jgi:5-methylcytosine-specific restriction endonuclease McrA
MHRKFQPINFTKRTGSNPHSEKGIYKPYSTPIETEKHPITAQEKRAHSLLPDQSHRCYWCCQSMTYVNSHIIHLIPRTEGGSEQRSNLRVICDKCDRIKGNMTHMDMALHILGAGQTFHYRLKPVLFGYTTGRLSVISDNQHN